MYSRQRAVSDGTLQRLDVAISYIRRADINVLLDGVQTSNWSWAGNSDAIQFPSPIPNGVEVTIVRTSQNDRVIHEFTKGAAFVNSSMDDDFRQMLFLAQEYTEGAGQTDFFHDIDMHGFRIKNLADGVDPGDVVTKAQLDSVSGDANAAATAANAAASAALAAASSAADAARQANTLPATLATAVGSAMVGWQYSRGGRVRTVSDRLKDTIHLADFCIPGAADISSGFQAAIAKAREMGQPIYAPAADWVFTSTINFPDWFPGIIGDGINKTRFWGNVSAGQWAWARAGGGDVGRWIGFTLRAGQPGDTQLGARSVQRNGFDMQCYGGLGKIDEVLFVGFNGFGVRITSIWDSNVGHMVTDECGNATSHAFSVVSGTDTSNHTVFARLHVERSHGKAMSVRGLNLEIGDIHSERTVEGVGYTHEFFDDIVLHSGRFENQPGDPRVSMRIGIATGSVSSLKVVGSVDFVYGARLGTACYVTSCSMGDVTVATGNLRRYVFRGCSMTRFVNRYSERPTVLEDCDIGDIDNAVSGCVTELVRSRVTVNIITSGGNNTLRSHDSIISNWPQTTVVEVSGGEVLNGVTTPFAQNTIVRNVLFREYVQIQSNNARWDSDSCIYVDIRFGGGSPAWKFGPNDSARGPVAAVFLVAPAASNFPRVVGERSYRLLSAVGQPDYWVNVAVGNGTWKPIGIVPA